MRSVEAIRDSLKNLALLHGDVSEVVAKEKSLLALALLALPEPDFDGCFDQLQRAADIMVELGLEDEEVGLDIEYRMCKALESRATTEEQVEEATQRLNQVIAKRLKWDKDFPRPNIREPPAPAEEEIDSTMCYLDEAENVHQTGKSLGIAIELLDRCVTLRKCKFGEKSAALSSTLLTLADYLREAGQFARARQCLQDSLAFAVRTFGRVDLKVAEILNSLGNLQRVCMEFPESESSLMEALSIRKEILGVTHVQVAASLNNIAELFRERGDWMTAIEWHKKSISMFESLEGESHPGTINAKGNYGVTLQRLAQISATDGTALLNEAIEFMHAKAFDKNHPWLSKFATEFLLSEARRFATAHDYERSIELYDTIIHRKEEVIEEMNDSAAGFKGVPSDDLTDSNPQLSSLDRRMMSTVEFERFETKLQWTQSQLDTCCFLEAMGNCKDCESFAVNRISDPPQSQHEKQLTSQLIIIKAQIARTIGDFELAQTLGKQATDLCESIICTESGLITKPFLFLSDLYCELGLFKDAEIYCLKVVKVLQHQVDKDNLAFGKASMQTSLVLAQALVIMARLRFVKGNIDSALSFFDRAMDLIEKHGLQNHAVNAEALLLIGRIDSMLGSHDRVMGHLESALRAQQVATGKQHIHFALIECWIARTMALTGAFDGAMLRLESAAKIVKSVVEQLNPRHPVVAQVLTAKASVLQQMSKQAEAREEIQHAYEQMLSCYQDDAKHIGLLDICWLFGTLSMESGDFKSAITYIGQAQMIHMRYFSPEENALEVNQQLWWNTRLSLAQAQIAWNRGVFADYDMQAFERLLLQLVAQLQRVHAHWKGDHAVHHSDAGSLLLSEVYTLSAKFFLFIGKFQEAQSFIGRSGTELKKYFQQWDSPLLYGPLLLLGRLFMEQDKFKEAKVLYSFAMLNGQLLLGTKLSCHRLLIDTALLSVENMRRVGYFHDALEAIDIVIKKIEKEYGSDSIEMLQCRYLEATLIRDRQKYSKAELLFAELESKWTEVYSPVSIHQVSYFRDLGKCYLMQQKIGPATTQFAASTELLSRFQFSWAKVPLQLELNADMQYVSYFGRPNEQAAALKILKDNILHDLGVVYGVNHSKTWHVKGRIALFMNQAQKGSGRKPLFEVLRAFDELKPYPLPFDHPYILELGGYEKASSKDRLSVNIAEMALYSWSEVKAEDYYDPNSSSMRSKYSPLIPKAIFVDMKNNDPLQWGLVHYYGHDVDAQAAKRGRSRVIMQRGDTSRSPSPSGGASTMTGKAASEKAGKPTVAELTDKLNSEIAARKLAEDSMVQLRHEKVNVEEQLDAEKLKSSQLAKDLQGEQEKTKSLTDQLTTLTNEFSALKARLAHVEEQLAEKIRKEEEEAARKKLEQELAEAEARLRAERLAQGDDQDTNSVVSLPLTPEQIKDLEAAEFLLQRAIVLHESGWYRQAQPLFDEARKVREEILTIKKMPTIEVIRWQAVNQRLIGNCAIAEELFILCENTLFTVFGKDNEAYLVAKLEWLWNLYDLGNYASLLKELDMLANSINIKSQDLELLTKEANAVLTAAADHEAAKRLGEQVEAEESADEADVGDDDNNGTSPQRKRKSKKKSKKDQTGGAVTLAARKQPPTEDEINEAKSQLISLSAQTRSINIIFGRLLTLQAMIALDEGKFAESKAHIERSQALLSKSVGLNDWLTVRALTVKARIFAVLARPKECISIIEQASMTIVLLLKVNEPPEQSSQQQQGNNNKKDIDQYDHPLLADLYVIFAQAFLVQCLYTDASKKLIRARWMREKYFKFSEIAYRDIRLLELDALDTQIVLAACNVFKAKERFHSIESQLQETLLECHRNESNIKKHTLFLMIHQQQSCIEIQLGEYVAAQERLVQVNNQLKLLQLPSNIYSYEVTLRQVQIMHLTGDFFTSRDIIENVIEKLKKCTQKDFPLLLHFVLFHAQYFDHNNETEVAEKYFERVFKYLKSQFPHGHPLCIDALMGLVLMHLRNAQPRAARKVLKDVEHLALSVFAFANTHEIFAKIIVMNAKISLFEFEHPESLLSDVVDEEGSTGKNAEDAMETGEADSSRNEIDANRGSEEEKGTDEDQQKQTMDVPIEEDIPVNADEASPAGQDTSSNELPIFDNKVFLEIGEKYMQALEKLAIVYTGPAEDRSISSSSIQEMIDSEEICFGPPIVTFIVGLLGQIRLKEFIALQRYIHNLSTSQREKYFLQQQEKEKNRTKRKALLANATALTTATPEPEGKRIIETSIARLIAWEAFKPDHEYILELQEILQDLVLQFDDLQIAQMYFKRANQLKANGSFSFADKLYDEAFILLFNALGSQSALSSLLIAQLLYEKAENSRFLARKPSYCKSLHVMAIRIYKRHVNDENAFDGFVAKNLFHMMFLLVDQHQYEEAFTMFQSLQSNMLRSYPSFAMALNIVTQSNEELTELKALLIDDHNNAKEVFLIFIAMQVVMSKCAVASYRLDEAMSLNANAMELIKLYSSCDPGQAVDASNEALAEILIRIYLNDIAVQDLLGNFGKSEELVEQVQSVLDTWKKQHLLQNEQRTLQSRAATQMASRAKSSQSRSASPAKASRSKSRSKSPTRSSMASLRSQSQRNRNEYKSSGGSALIDMIVGGELGENSAKLRVIQADICLSFAEHALVLHRLAESKLWAEKSLEIRRQLCNRVKPKPATAPVAKSSAGEGGRYSAKSDKSPNVFDPNEEPEWSRQKQEEVRSSFLNAIDMLINGGHDTADESDDANANDDDDENRIGKAQHKLTKNPSVVRAESVTGDAVRGTDLDAEIEETNDQIVKDFESTQAGLATDADNQSAAAGSESNSTKKSTVSIGVTLIDFMLEEEKLFAFREEKLTAHTMIAETIFVISKIELLLGNVSNTKEAVEIAQQMLTALYPKQTMFKLKVVFLRAKLRWLQNQLEDSKSMHAKLLEQRLSIAGSSILINLDVAESYAAMAQIHITMGHFDDAMQYINDSLKIERRLFQKYASEQRKHSFANNGMTFKLPSSAVSAKEKDSHYRIQSLLVICANILYQKGMYNDAQLLIDSCLSTQKNNFAVLDTQMHLSIVEGMILKGRTHLAMGQCDDALTTFQLSKSMMFVIVGERHYEVGLLYLYIAQTMRMMGKLLECKQQLDLAVTTIRSQLGKYHVYTIHTLLEIGLNFMDLGKYITGQHVLERAIHLLKKSLGKDHLLIAAGYHALAELHLAMGLYDKVGKYLEDSLYITRKVIGSDRFPLVASVMSTLNELKSVKGTYDESIQGFDDTIALLKIIYNTPNHFQIAKVLIILAKTFLLQGKIYDAKAQFDKAYLMVKSLSPSTDHVLLYESQLGVAQCLLRIGRIDQAKALFERCLSSFKDWKGSQHPSIATVLNLLGDVYNLLQRLQTAENLLVEAYTLRMKTLREVNEAHPEIIQNWLSFAENLRLRGLFIAPKVDAQEKNKGSADNEGPAGSDSQKDRLLISDAMKLKIARDAMSGTAEQSPANAKASPSDNRTKTFDDPEELDDVDAILSQTDKIDPDVEDQRQKNKKFVIDSDSIFTEASKPNGEKGLVATMLEPSTATEAATEAVTEMALGEHGMTVSASMLRTGPSMSVANIDQQNEGGPDGQSQGSPEIIQEDDLESAPTVMISAIEKLDRDDLKPKPAAADNQIQEGEEADGDDATMPGGIVSEIQRFLQDESEYRAMPLLERALTSLLVLFGDDHMHPMVFCTQHLMAETTRGLGDFDKALSQHEQLFMNRRKVLGDQHYDTITTLISIAELLRVMKKVFNTGSSSKPMHSSANGTGTLANQANNIGAGGVSLLDHLTSLLVPPKLPPKPKAASGNHLQLDEDDEEELFGDTEEEKLRRIRKKTYEEGKEWLFLTKSDFNKESSGKKPKPLPKPRGYMGYAFPPVKRESIDESTGTMLQAINSSSAKPAGAPSNSPLQDAKKCTDLVVNLLKKLLASEEFGITLKKNDLFDHPIVASALYNKAEISRLRGEGAQALKFLEQSLAMRRRLFRAHHPAVAECLFSMAELLRSDQRYAQSLPIYDKTLEIRIETYGATHFSVAEVENSIALVHIALGDFPRAQEVLLHALDLCELTLGPNHPSTAFACSNHASLLQAMGEYKDSLAWYRKALQIKQKIFGDKHPEIASTLNNMGLLYKAQGSFAEALVCYEKALAIQKACLGSNHPDIASSLNNFAAVLAVQEGRKFEAKEYFKQSLAIRTSCYGSDNALVASTMNNYAGLLYSLGETSHAHEMFEESLRIRKMVLGEEHPSVAESLHNLGFFYLSQQQYYEARLAYEEALKIRQKIFGPDHLIVATTALHLSNSMVQMKDFEQALLMARDAYRIREHHLGDLHEDTIASKKSLERIEKKMRKFAVGTPSANERPRTTPSIPGQRPKAAKNLPLQSSTGELKLGENNMD